MPSELNVVYFYKDKENIVNSNSQKDQCQELAETFFYGIGKPDDCKYSLEIKRRMIDRTLTQLATFKYFKEEDAFDLVLSGFIPKKQENGMVINPGQKWHLYVSYFAYQEINAILKLSSDVIEVPGDKFVETSFCFGSKVRQKEYVKWMKEAAGFDENVPWEYVEKSVGKLRQ